MRLVTFQPEGSGPRIGALFDNYVVDLNEAYRQLLHPYSDPIFIRKLADSLLPADMIDFFRTGELGLQTARQTITAVEQNIEKLSPTSDAAVYDLSR